MGLLDPLYNAVSWVLLRFHSFWSLIFNPDSGAAWGLSIVLLVVLIRICLIPLFVKQIKAQRGLQALQPQMKAIQTKYKNDKAKQQEELMKLYRETGTNPLSSCLPIIVQAPFFFALYHVLSYIAQGRTVGVITDQATVISAHSATIFGAPIYETFRTGDLNTKIVAGIFIVAMTATTFITQRQLMVKNQPLGQSSPLMQQQKILLYVFPVHVRRLRHQLPARCPHLLADDQPVDDGRSRCTSSGGTRLPAARRTSPCRRAGPRRRRPRLPPRPLLPV